MVTVRVRAPAGPPGSASQRDVDRLSSLTEQMEDGGQRRRLRWRERGQGRRAGRIAEGRGVRRASGRSCWRRGRDEGAGGGWPEGEGACLGGCAGERLAGVGSEAEGTDGQCGWGGEEELSVSEVSFREVTATLHPLHDRSASFDGRLDWINSVTCIMLRLSGTAGHRKRVLGDTIVARATCYARAFGRGARAMIPSPAVPKTAHHVPHRKCWKKNRGGAFPAHGPCPKD
ncbi:hypothetical protein CALCODRAFT_73757 [Calocera cornea HHB12733]|uniref:Uncharacterized protein n=1 Tax=Calocera cornea HHB12733 TaxID=1353952 RepID=A0A165IU73_9BASI|nr:hypothetical protein CALCODRAFT_73757 [Calocera cornea HHB12733]